MNKLYPTIVFAALLALASGCEQDKNAPVMHGEDFVPNDTMRASEKFMLAQEAAGARHDATLNAQHFNGKDLGSLGEQKLDLMMQDDDVNIVGRNLGRVGLDQLDILAIGKRALERRFDHCGGRAEQYADRHRVPRLWSGFPARRGGRRGA